MNRQQAFDTLTEIASGYGISIENRIRPDGDWTVTPLSCFRAVRGKDGDALIFLGPHRVAAVIGDHRDRVKLAEMIVKQANQSKMEVAHANQP